MLKGQYFSRTLPPEPPSELHHQPTAELTLPFLPHLHFAITRWLLVLEFLELFLSLFVSGIVPEKHHILAVVLEMFLKSHFCLRCSQGL